MKLALQSVFLLFFLPEIYSASYRPDEPASHRAVVLSLLWFRCPLKTFNCLRETSFNWWLERMKFIIRHEFNIDWQWLQNLIYMKTLICSFIISLYKYKTGWQRKRSEVTQRIINDRRVSKRYHERENGWQGWRRCAAFSSKPRCTTGNERQQDWTNAQEINKQTKWCKNTHSREPLIHARTAGIPPSALHSSIHTSISVHHF